MIFSVGEQLVFAGGQNVFSDPLYNKPFPLNGQTSWENSQSISQSPALAETIYQFCDLLSEVPLNVTFRSI